MKNANTKLDEVQNDARLSPAQKELIQKWVKHLKTFKDDLKILEEAYTIREFAIFIKKPFQDANITDKVGYLNHKKHSKESITGNRVMELAPSSLDTYKYKLNNFYRWILKHTNEKIDQEMAYPTPKIIRKEERSLEQNCQRRVNALLNNELICTNKKEDKYLTQNQLKEKYSSLLLSEINLKTLNEYKIYKFTSGIVESYIGFVSKLGFLKRLGLFLDKKTKSYKSASREDIQHFLNEVQKNLESGKINMSYKADILDFYRFVYGMFGDEQPKQYPEVVSWLYQKRKKSHDKVRKEIISDKEIKCMVDACTEQRDRALIELFGDCSARNGEIVNTCIKDVKITEISKTDNSYKHFIATITLRGKTGERTNTLFSSVANLRLYLLTHPLKDNPDAPLFMATKESRYGQRLTRVGINKILQRAAKRAEIKKHIHAHLFRHSNLTKMAKILSESELKIHAGWGSNSKMASVYVHLTEKDVANKILQTYGLVNKEETADNFVKVMMCANKICGYQNPGDAKFCLKCGYPMTREMTISLAQIKEKEAQLQNQLMSTNINPAMLSQATDFKEGLYQVLKNNKDLVEKLKDIVNLAEGLK